MELEEAKKVLMSLPEYQDLVSKEFEAIDTVIHELVALQNLLDEKREEIEHLQKENEELKKERSEYYADYQEYSEEGDHIPRID